MSNFNQNSFPVRYLFKGIILYILYQCDTIDQRTNGPVNAHLIFGPRISIYNVRQRSREPHIPSFTHLVKYINQFPGHMLQ